MALYKSGCESGWASLLEMFWTADPVPQFYSVDQLNTQQHHQTTDHFDWFESWMSAPPSCEYSNSSAHQFTPRSTPVSLGTSSPLEFSRNVPSTSSSCGGGGRHLCAVCGDPAEGIHFGAQSCAACGAFFRRSVSDQKVYSCDGKKCLGNGRTTKKGGNCRYCRFQKCINAGMQPLDVHTRRQKQKEGRSSLHDDQLKSIFLGENSTPTLESLVQLRRDFAVRRHLLFATKELGGNSVTNHIEEMAIEWKIFSQIIATHPLMKEFGHSTGGQIDLSNQRLGQANPHLRDLFFSNYLFELALSTVRNGGVQMDRSITTGGLKVELLEEELSRFFRSSRIHDPICMARLCLPLFVHLVRVCARSLQALCIDEIETAFLYYAVIGSLRAPQSLFSGNGILSKLCSELSSHYDSTPEEIAQKMGNLMLTISPFREALRMFREYITLLELESLTI